MVIVGKRLTLPMIKLLEPEVIALGHALLEEITRSHSLSVSEHGAYHTFPQKPSYYDKRWRMKVMGREEVKLKKIPKYKEPNPRMGRSESMWNNFYAYLNIVPGTWIL